MYSPSKLILLISHAWVETGILFLHLLHTLLETKNHSIVQLANSTIFTLNLQFLAIADIMHNKRRSTNEFVLIYVNLSVWEERLCNVLLYQT